MRSTHLAARQTGKHASTDAQRPRPKRAPPSAPARLEAGSSCACGGGCPRCQARSGQPLDSAVRSDMERRFGHDFSDVRVHTDSAAQASAAAEGALAYAAGTDVVFGAGRYRPNTIEGRWLIGHELAHVIQQRGSAGGQGTASEGALEREAGDAGMRVALGGRAQVGAAQGAPATQYLRVSQGGFGKALEEFTNLWHVEDKAIRLLQQSATFMKLAFTLDQHYVWPMDPRFGNVIGDWEVGPDGNMLKPPAAAGKRPLFVVEDEPSFMTFNTPGNNLSGDVISVKSTDTPTFIQGLAHEATHAATSVGAAAPRPQTLVDEINAGVKEEIATRQNEAKILGEIPDPKVKANVATVGTRVPREVERDVSPAFNLTYMELFFFGRELADAQAAEGITDQEAMAIREDIDKKLPAAPFVISKKVAPSGIFPLSDYAETWFARQTAVSEWKDFLKTNSPNDPSFTADKEALLQDHATRFFKGKVSYSP